MKKAVAILLPLAAAICASAVPFSAHSAATASPRPDAGTAKAAKSPLLGSWQVDVSRLPIPPAARPKRVTITYSEAGGGKWRTDVEIVDADGNVTHGVAEFPLDGTQVEGHGSPEADRIAATMPQPNVLITSLAKGTVPASTRIYAVAKDGQSMVETAVYFSDEGKSIMRTNYFSRTKNR